MSPSLKKHILTFLLLVFLSIPLTLQAFHPGFFVKDDGEWMIIRSSAFHEALRDGQFPVRFLGRLNYEYGYPVPTFLYPAYLYLTEPLLLLGFGVINSIKIMFTLTMVFSGIFTYLWLSKLFDRWAALIGALVYLYTPYHLIDMYRRGSLGEMLALAIVPFILWSIERRSILFSSFGVALLILSHNIMAALFLPVIFIYVYVSRISKSTQWWRSLHVFRLVGMTYGFGLGLTAFFWLPALYELQFTVFKQTKMFDWQHYFAPYASIGGLPLVLILTAIVLMSFNYRSKQQERESDLLGLFAVIGLGAVFFSSFYSTYLWHILPVTLLQFPFRFLSLEIIAVAFIAAYLLHVIRQKVVKIFFAIVIITALSIGALPYVTGIPYYNKGEGFYTSNLGTTNSGDEYMPVWVTEKPIQKPKQIVEIKDGKIADIKANNKEIFFTATASKQTIVQINKIYWPGWKAIVDNNVVVINYNNKKGVITFPVSRGNHTVEVIFEETQLRLFADFLSVSSFVGLIGFCFIENRKKDRKT